MILLISFMAMFTFVAPEAIEYTNTLYDNYNNQKEDINDLKNSDLKYLSNDKTATTTEIDIKNTGSTQIYKNDVVVLADGKIVNASININGRNGDYILPSEKATIVINDDTINTIKIETLKGIVIYKDIS